MIDRFRFRAVLKTNDFAISVQPYYVLENGYFIDLNVAQNEFEKKYPNDCFWDFLDKIKTQDYIQEISTDSDLIITRDFTNLVQSTGLKDAKGNLIYEGDILLSPDGDYPYRVLVDWFDAEAKFVVNAWNGKEFEYLLSDDEPQDLENFEIIGNMYENKDLLEATE